MAVDGALDERLGVGGGVVLGRRLEPSAAEDEAVAPVVLAAGGFSLVAVDALVDPDVLVVAQTGFDEVVEFHAGGWPFGQRRGNSSYEEPNDGNGRQCQTLHGEPLRPRSLVRI